ncbi:hypothetical protein D3C77_528860 [compost metagenome]
MRHMREAAVQTIDLIRGMALAGYGIIDPHIMRKTNAAGILLVIARKSNGIFIAEAFHEHIQLISHRPWIHPQLIIQLVYGKVERVHHPVFAFIDNPEGIAVIIEQLRAAIVTTDGMCQHESLILIKSRIVN